MRRKKEFNPKNSESGSINKLFNEVLAGKFETFIANKLGLATPEDRTQRITELGDLSEEEKARILEGLPPTTNEIDNRLVLSFIAEDFINVTYNSSSISTKQKGYEIISKAYFGEALTLGGKNAKEDIEKKLSLPNLSWMLPEKE